MKVALVLFTSCVVWFYEVSGQSSVGPDVACTSDSSCSMYSGTYCGGYSQCKKCVCPSTGYVYVASDTACLATAKIGEACSNDLQCPDKQGGTSAGGSCTSSKCACDTGYLATSDQTSCHLPYPTEDCTTAQGCNTPTVVTCTDSKCACNSGYVVDSTKTTCREPIVAEPCANNPGCSTTLSSCTDSECACNSGYIKDSSSDTCRRSYIGEACTAATDCIDTTTMDCTNSKCECKSTHPTENTDKQSCRQNYIGEDCTDVDQCLSSITNVTCTDSKCKCPSYTSGPADDKQSCLAQELDGECQSDANCIQPSTMSCTGSVCACKTDYKEVSKTECRLPLYGESCNSSGTAVACNDAMDPNLNSTCPEANTCECATGYQQTTAGQLCTRTPLGQACTVADAGYCGTATLCNATNLVCTCLDDYIQESNGIDCRQPTYDEACTAGQSTCTGTNVATVCADTNKCVCDTNRQVTDNACVLSKLDESCTNAATDCDQSITSVVCTDNLCKCPSTLTAENGNCVEVKYGQDCSGGKTCESPYTCSSSNKCDCTTDNVYDSAISGCRNTGAVVAAKEGAQCTDMTGVAAPIDWTNTNPVYKRCDMSLTGTSALTCRQCDNNGNLTCNTAISDPQDSASVAVHANVFVIVLLMIMTLFYMV